MALLKDTDERPPWRGLVGLAVVGWEFNVFGEDLVEEIVGLRCELSAFTALIEHLLEGEWGVARHEWCRADDGNVPHVVERSHGVLHGVGGHEELSLHDAALEGQ